MTYNTWFVYGTRVNDAIVAQLAPRLSETGVELFQLDAGCHAGAGLGGTYDFTSGLGSWAVDEHRFRDGLRGIAEMLREHGLKFGLWVEPERIDLATLNEERGPREGWLARSHGAYRPGLPDEEAGYAQICLAHPEAWQWVHDHLARLVEQESVEYLVLDSNDWITCTRDDHGHGPRDGAFAHVQALYRLLASLRERFPSLLIENCAGGGNRLDLGLARYTDAGWMDDRTTPSAHVRRVLQGLSPILPPSSLLSYAMPSPEEPMDEEHDLRLIVRSRMAGVLGLSYRAEEVDERAIALLADEIDLYKQARALVRDGAGTVLTPQTGANASPPWELMQQLASNRRAAGVEAIRNDGAVGTVRVVPRGLDPDIDYEVWLPFVGRVGG